MFINSFTRVILLCHVGEGPVPTALVIFAFRYKIRQMGKTMCAKLLIPVY